MRFTESERQVALALAEWYRNCSVGLVVAGFAAYVLGDMGDAVPVSDVWWFAVAAFLMLVMSWRLVAEATQEER